MSKLISQFCTASRFLDIGSGTGSVVLQVARQTQLSCTGVEINPEAYALSLKNASTLTQEVRGRVTLLNADILKMPMQADIVYICNTAFSIYFQANLSNWLEGQRFKQIFTLRPLLGMRRYTINKRFLVSCSWDNALCYKYRPTIGEW